MKKNKDASASLATQTDTPTQNARPSWTAAKRRRSSARAIASATHSHQMPRQGVLRCKRSRARAARANEQTRFDVLFSLVRKRQIVVVFVGQAQRRRCARTLQQPRLRSDTQRHVQRLPCSREASNKLADARARAAMPPAAGWWLGTSRKSDGGSLFGSVMRFVFGTTMASRLLEGEASYQDMGTYRHDWACLHGRFSGENSHVSK